jgi:hypothetical protein
MMYRYDGAGYRRPGADEPAEAGLLGTDQPHGHRGAPIDPRRHHSRGRPGAPNLCVAHPRRTCLPRRIDNTDRTKRRDLLTSR